MSVRIVNFDTSQIPLNFSIPGDPEVYEILFLDLNSIQQSMMNKAIAYSIGLACAIVFSLVLLLVHKNKRSPTFILNQASMIVFIIRCSLYLAYLMGPFMDYNFQLTGLLNSKDYPKHKITIAANALYTILITLIEATFVYQIYSVFISPEIKKLGLILTALSAALGLTAVGWYLYLTIASSLRFESSLRGEEAPIYISSKLSSVPIIIFTTTVNVMSLVLIAKLAMAIRTRRYLGLKQFDSLHIVMIMMTQTFIVPSVLTIINSSLENTLGEENLLYTISMILIVLSLPLTSMWANAANNNPQPSSGTPFQLRTRSNSLYSETVTPKSNTHRFSFFPEKLLKKRSERVEDSSNNPPLPLATVFPSVIESNTLNSPTIDHLGSIFCSDDFSEIEEGIFTSNQDGSVSKGPSISIKTYL